MRVKFLKDCVLRYSDFDYYRENPYEEEKHEFKNGDILEVSDISQAKDAFMMDVPHDEDEIKFGEYLNVPPDCYEILND